MIRPSLRRATQSDLDAITAVALAASPDDPNYDYRSPQRKEYLEDFAFHLGLKCQEYLDNNVVVVAESPLLSDPEKKRIVAFSVWDKQLPGKHARNISVDAPLGAGGSPQSTNTSLPPRRDADALRMSAFREACATHKTRLFDQRFARGHMFLKILLTHPDYRCRGAGTTLTSWGVRQARREGLSTTLFASPMGHQLYRKLGFRVIHRFRVQVPGDDAFLEIPAMVLSPELEPKTGLMARRRARSARPVRVVFAGKTEPPPPIEANSRKTLPPMIEVH